MFLESIAANLVNKFCRRFIKDFKKENLSLSLSGEVVLTQFEVNTDEIKQLQLPVELKSFYVGKLRMRVPLVHLTTQSAEIELSDVNVLLGTPRDPKWDLDSLYIAEQTKIFLMTLLLDQFSSENPSSTPTPAATTGHHHHTNKPPKGNQGPLTPSIAALIQNSHITIERIHVRFEDGLASENLVDIESPTLSYALGVTLASLVVYPSTPSTATAVPANDKVLSLKQLSVYLKSDALFEDMAPDARAAAFRAPFEESAPVDASSKSHLPLLEPLSVDVHVQMTLLPVVQLAFKVHVPVVHVNVAPAHYQFLDAFLTHVDRFDRFSLYRRFRPVTNGDKKRTNWKDWWRYAIVAVMMDLNDPVRRKPTWRSTLNLVLVGLQYTALRRKVTPYLIRQTTGTADHHFLQYREDFKGNDSHSKSPLDRSLTLASETIPKHVTHFGDGIFAGVYGLYRCFPRHMADTALKSNAPTGDAAAIGLRQAEPVVADPEDASAEAKKLWHRQLCIDASFRPVIVAKLRALAVRQMDHKEHKTAVSTKLHNTTKGTLTLTLMEGQAIPKPMVLFCKVKVGHKGTPYTGELVHCDPTDDPTKKHSTLDVLFAQSFEFRVEGTPNEDFLHVNLFDRWPMFNQFVGKFRIPLAALTSTSHSDQVVVLESADKKAHRMQLHVLSVFVPDAASSPKAKAATVDAAIEPSSFASSTAMMQALYPDVYASKLHSINSWYTGKAKPSLQSLTMDATLAKLHVAFVFPSKATAATNSSSKFLPRVSVAAPKTAIDQLVIELQAMQYRLKFVPSHLKHAMVVGRFDMHHAVTDRLAASPPKRTNFFQAPRRRGVDDDDALAPFASFEQVIDAKQPVKSKISTQDVQVTVDIPVLLRHVLFVVEKVPELTVFSALFAAPVYQAMMKYTGEEATAPAPDAAPVPKDTTTDRTASRTSSSSAVTSPRFLGSWKWTSERPGAQAPPPTPSAARTATTPALPAQSPGKGKDRSGEFSAHIELGALHLALAGATSPPSPDDGDENGAGNQDAKDANVSPLNVLEVVVPGSSLHVTGGKGLPTEIKSGTSTSLVKMERDMPWVLDQLDRIGRMVKRQLKVDARPFYDKPHLASRYKVQRFEYEIHELERQLAMFRVLIRQVVAAPATYRIDAADCDSLRLMVRDMQPKVIDASAATISSVQFDAIRMVLQQGLTVLKHNVRKGDPSWRVLWLQDNPKGSDAGPEKTTKALCLAKPNDRKNPKVLPLASLAGVVTNVMTPALARTGDAKALDTYLVLQVVDEVKPLSLEFASTEIRNHVATTLTRLLPPSK